MALVAGSSSEAFFCVASRMNVSERITSSSALMDFSRPTNSGTIMWGKTTMSRNGSTGQVRVSPGINGGRGLALVMGKFLYRCAPRPKPAICGVTAECRKTGRGARRVRRNKEREQPLPETEQLRLVAFVRSCPVPIGGDAGRGCQASHKSEPPGCGLVDTLKAGLVKNEEPVPAPL